MSRNSNDIKKLNYEDKLEKAKAKYDERITTVLPRSEDASDNEYHVHLNGKNYIIQRGKTVSIPKAVYDVIQHKLDLSEKIYNIQQEKSENITKIFSQKQ